MARTFNIHVQWVKTDCDVTAQPFSSTAVNVNWKTDCDFMVCCFVCTVPVMHTSLPFFAEQLYVKMLDQWAICQLSIVIQDWRWLCSPPTCQWYYLMNSSPDGMKMKTLDTFTYSFSMVDNGSILLLLVYFVSFESGHFVSWQLGTRCIKGRMCDYFSSSIECHFVLEAYVMPHQGCEKFWVFGSGLLPKAQGACRFWMFFLLKVTTLWRQQNSFQPLISQTSSI